MTFTQSDFDKLDDFTKHEIELSVEAHNATRDYLLHKIASYGTNAAANPNVYKALAQYIEDRLVVSCHWYNNHHVMIIQRRAWEVLKQIRDENFVEVDLFSNNFQ